MRSAGSSRFQSIAWPDGIRDCSADVIASLEKWFKKDGFGARLGAVVATLNAGTSPAAAAARAKPIVAEAYKVVVDPALQLVLAINLCLLVWRTAMRWALVRRAYGRGEAWREPIRECDLRKRKGRPHGRPCFKNVVRVSRRRARRSTSLAW